MVDGIHVLIWPVFTRISSRWPEGTHSASEGAELYASGHPIFTADRGHARQLDGNGLPAVRQ